MEIEPMAHFVRSSVPLVEGGLRCAGCSKGLKLNDDSVLGSRFSRPRGVSHDHQPVAVSQRGDYINIELVIGVNWWDTTWCLLCLVGIGKNRGLCWYPFTRCQSKCEL